MFHDLAPGSCKGVGIWSLRLFLLLLSSKDAEGISCRETLINMVKSSGNIAKLYKPPSPWKPPLCSLFLWVWFPCIRDSYTICLSLTYFSWQNAPKVLPCDHKCQGFLSFPGWIIFHNRVTEQQHTYHFPHLLYPFIHLWAFSFAS